MLQNTFCHIPGVSAAREQALWAAGIRSWDAFRHPAPALTPGKSREVVAHLETSRRQIAVGDPLPFADGLPAREHWRLFPEFRDSVAYLDIETTGLTRGVDAITTIALYDGREIRHYVQGQNLEAFREEIGRYRLLVTYNGKSFDVPFIERALGGAIPHAHIDLRYVLASLGFRGWLKGCERQMGLDRGGLEGVDGYFAVLLWRDYQRSGDRRALETLLAYNIEDVVNLETLMVTAYNLKLRETPFAESHALPHPGRPEIPFRADGATIARLKRQSGY